MLRTAERACCVEQQFKPTYFANQKTAKIFRRKVQLGDSIVQRWIIPLPLARSRSAICSACAVHSSCWFLGRPPASILRAMVVALARQFLTLHCA
jgi:hypothetical protein